MYRDRLGFALFVLVQSQCENGIISRLQDIVCVGNKNGDFVFAAGKHNIGDNGKMKVSAVL